MDYQLLDFGNGRKLERFGKLVLDRPAPIAAGKPTLPRREWQRATARYERGGGDEGTWKSAEPLPEAWTCEFLVEQHALTFELRPSPFGHVGVFAEQLANWRWLVNRIARASRPLKLLNLFAYTGGSSLAAAAAGAEMTHVDAAANIVQRARRNAELSRLADRPVRWITEDVRKYCERELRRGNYYDGVILDPPTFGRGPKGEPWQIEKHLLGLLDVCSELTRRAPTLVLVTCHTASIGPAELGAYVADGMFGSCSQSAATGQLTLDTAEGCKIPSGVFARWPAN